MSRNNMLKWFNYEHLPTQLKEVGVDFSVFAERLDDYIADGPEKQAGMRKLLEAKDCFVRAKIEGEEES